jgi:hypothetical protein
MYLQRLRHHNREQQKQHMLSAQFPLEKVTTLSHTGKSNQLNIPAKDHLTHLNYLLTEDLAYNF